MIPYQRRFCSMLFLVLLLAPVAVEAGSRNYGDVSGQRTREALERIPCINGEELDTGHQLLKALGYNEMRIFRAFTDLPGIHFSLAVEFIAVLVRQRVSYEQVLAFEGWSGLDGADAVEALSALGAIASLDLRDARTFAAFCSTEGARADVALGVVSLLTSLPDQNSLAARAFFLINGTSARQALDGLRTIARLEDMQAWACEYLAQVAGMTPARVLDGLPLLLKLRKLDAWNAKVLFSGPQVTADQAWFWLVSYLAQPVTVQEGAFTGFPEERKVFLLRVMHSGGEEVCRWINNLHDITDSFGREIGSRRLNATSIKDLMRFFHRLSPPTKARFGQEAQNLSRAGNHGGLIALLKRATAADRRQVAGDGTTPNVYALLAQGSELYDSSFRDILVPILRQRIENRYPAGLLAFLADVDPGNLLVSDFIVSLALKGKLTDFFPESAEGQARVLDLVAESAFDDEDSLILFSATFANLLEVLQPGARAYLIRQMAAQIEAGEGVFSRQVQVILQYYLEEFPELLGEGDKALIAKLVARRGAVDLGKYQRSPFAEWKADGRLRSLSLFHPDDDGRDSFRSNGATLLQSGYRPRISTFFIMRELDEAERRAGANLAASDMEKLFDAMLHHGFVIDFVKKVGEIEIVHSVVAYKGEDEQARLLEQFVRGGCEMFAQRGHSYWRQEQIILPMTKLLETERLKKEDLRAKWRFLSLGSCGGIKAYSRLIKLFEGRVDILATIGTGTSVINDPYNKNFFEIIATSPDAMTWKALNLKAAAMFGGDKGRDYLQPASLPSILHKILDEEGER